jgi:hypothetical protein
MSRMSTRGINKSLKKGWFFYRKPGDAANSIGLVFEPGLVHPLYARLISMCALVNPKAYSNENQ